MALDPAAARLLRLLKTQEGGDPSDFEGRRAGLEALTALAGAPRPAGVDVEDLLLPADQGGVRVRRYRGGGGRTPVVFAHGGGFTAGGLETHDGFCATLSRAAARQVFAVDYRLAPEHPYPAAIEDVGAALSGLRRSAGDLGIDADRPVLAGDSAGAGIVLAAGRRAAARGLDPVLRLLVCPILDLAGAHPSRKEFQRGFFIDPEAFARDRAAYVGAGDASDPELSPLVSDLGGDPPTSIHLAECDPFRDEGAAFAARLAAAGRQVRTTLHESQIHYFYALGRLMPAAARLIEALARDIREFAP